MPVLSEESSGAVVESLQRVLTNGAPGQWGTTPQGIDGIFGPHTKASIEAFQAWGGVAVDGIVGDQTWSVSLHAASATLETAVGLNFRSGLSMRWGACQSDRCEPASSGAGLDPLLLTERLLARAEAPVGCP
jgi:Putative peptidoglycan binding domain